MDDRWLSGRDHSELFAVTVGSAVKQACATVAQAPDKLSIGTGVAAVAVPAVVSLEMSYTMEQSVAFGGPDGPTCMSVRRPRVTGPAVAAAMDSCDL